MKQEKPQPAESKKEEIVIKEIEKEIENEYGFGFYGFKPTVRQVFPYDINGQLGIGYSSINSSSSVNVVLVGTQKLKKIGQNTVVIGADTTVGLSSGSSIGFNGIVGIETKLNKNVVLGLYVYPISFGQNYFGLFNGGTFSAHIYL